MNIKIEDMKNKIIGALQGCGMNAENASVMTDVYLRAAYRGVGHHDLADLSWRIDALKEGTMNPNPEIRKVSGAAALEVYDGDNGAGEICSVFITERSMELASLSGIGLVTIRNSNHFLSAAPYTEIADEKGYFTIIISKSPTGLTLPGMDKDLMGNNPFGFAAGYDDERLLYDVCCSYSSVGKMRELAKEGKTVPSHWGSDSSGRPTEHSQEIVESNLYMPMGEHKGFGLAVMMELLTSVLSGGTILREGEETSGCKGDYSQTAITIDPKTFSPAGEFRERTGTMTGLFKAMNPDIYLPGSRSVKIRREIEKRGYFEVDEDLLNMLEN